MFTSRSRRAILAGVLSCSLLLCSCSTEGEHEQSALYQQTYLMTKATTDAASGTTTAATAASGASETTSGTAAVSSAESTTASAGSTAASTVSASSAAAPASPAGTPAGNAAPAGTTAGNAAPAATTASTAAPAPGTTTSASAEGSAGSSTATAASTTQDIFTGTTAAAPLDQADEHGLTEEYKAFLSDTVFVGDSICSGLRVYGILPNDNCVAVGNVGARNIFDFTFPVRGSDLSLTYALSILQPKYIICSMGMNDIHMGSKDFFCQNYNRLMNIIQETLPDAKIFAASITPISNSSNFASNDFIDGYSAALKDYLKDNDKFGYVDIATGLKNEWNGLVESYNGGDGIHLSPDAYYVILRQVCEQLVDTGIASGVSDDGVAYGKS